MKTNLQSRKYPYYFESEIKPNNYKIVESGVMEIVRATKKYQKRNSEQISVLDVGSGRGDFSIQLAKAFKKVVGVEPYVQAYKYALKNTPKELKNISFHHKKIEQFQTKERFDLIVALTIFEHIQNPKEAFTKVFELLKPGGVIYLTAPNKYWIFEQHYGLPFLSWFPLRIANWYLKKTKGVNSFEDSSYSKGYYGMRKFFDNFPCKYEFILPFDQESAYIGYGKKGIYTYIKNFGIALIKLHPIFWSISKGFIMVIIKNK